MRDAITVYQKPTCTTCRQVFAALKESGVDFTMDLARPAQRVYEILPPPEKRN